MYSKWVKGGTFLATKIGFYENLREIGETGSVKGLFFLIQEKPLGSR